MPTYEVFLTDEASRDLSSIYSYIAVNDMPEKAERVMKWY
ncbi:hypothetical protein AGMMS49941_11500 [Deferribacterales bacterium]|nr:hypothetical protein AGMMS49941_11500 [Deferribacterales bacterium]